MRKFYGRSKCIRQSISKTFTTQTKGRLKTHISGFQTTFLLLKQLTAQLVMTDIDGFLFVACVRDEDDFFVHFADSFHIFTRVGREIGRASCRERV